jgi:hypothetical protein
MGEKRATDIGVLFGGMGATRFYHLQPYVREEKDMQKWTDLDFEEPNICRCICNALASCLGVEAEKLFEGGQ